MKITDGIYKTQSNGFQWSWTDTCVTFYVYKHTTGMRSSAFIHNEPLLFKEGHYTPDMCWDEMTLALLDHSIFCEPWQTPEPRIALPDFESP